MYASKNIVENAVNSKDHTTLLAAVKKMVAGDGGRHEIRITDENGGTATPTIADVDQSNGVIHVIDKVLLPKS